MAEQLDLKLTPFKALAEALELKHSDFELALQSIFLPELYSVRQPSRPIKPNAPLLSKATGKEVIDFGLALQQWETEITLFQIKQKSFLNHWDLAFKAVEDKIIYESNINGIGLRSEVVKKILAHAKDNAVDTDRLVSLYKILCMFVGILK